MWLSSNLELLCEAACRHVRYPAAGCSIALDIALENFWKAVNKMMLNVEKGWLPTLERVVVKKPIELASSLNGGQIEAPCRYLFEERHFNRVLTEALSRCSYTEESLGCIKFCWILESNIEFTFLV